jgi:hypothetical protein
LFAAHLRLAAVLEWACGRFASCGQFAADLRLAASLRLAAVLGWALFEHHVYGEKIKFKKSFYHAPTANLSSIRLKINKNTGMILGKIVFMAYF